MIASCVAIIWGVGKSNCMLAALGALRKTLGWALEMVKEKAL